MTSIRKVAVCAVLAISPVWAFAHGNQGSSQGHGPGMMMNQEHVQQMHQNWSRMDNMMQRIPNASSPQERQQLMQNHWETMQEQMNLMHQGMMGPGMMGGNQGSGMKNNAQSGNQAGPVGEQQFQLMQERMDQMQLMMEQMLKRQQQLN
ncbi:DUF4175 domain-containing protein [Marinobacter nauticus]